MKCPEWLENAIFEGKQVQCIVWDDNTEESKIANIRDFSPSDKHCFKGERKCDSYMNAEPYPTTDHVFIPFDFVLTRKVTTPWSANIFSHRSQDFFVCGGILWTYCIPYKGNEHLIGTMK